MDLTFDDGLCDFFSVAFPIVESFGYPVTLYLTTYYVEYNRPVFDPMCSYLLWKGRDQKQLEWPEVFPAPVALDDAGRGRASATIKQLAYRISSPAEKKTTCCPGLPKGYISTTRTFAGSA